MSFRPIQPASKQASSSNPRAELSGDSDIVPRKRSHITRQACNNCRKTKSKCDGERPACSTCVSKDQQCSYDPKPPGETVFVKMKTRLKALENLVMSLMQKSDHEAFNILRQIRASETIDILLESGMMDVDSPVVDPFAPAARSPTSPIFQTHALAAIDILEKGVDSFFDSSSKLFHVFTRQELDAYLQSLESGSGGDEQKLAVCCVAIVAAIGHQYTNLSPDEPPERTLYTIARNYLDDIMDIMPLESVRLCAMIAMYHTMDKSTAGLAYIDIGLRMARQHGLFSSHRNPDISGEKWHEYRRTWRTLLFQASWLACTLGYISSIEVITLRVPVASLPVDTSTELVDVVQTEMAKIVFLSAEMLRACLAFEDPNLKAVEPITKRLHDWYAMLPKDMHLGSLERDGLPKEIRRSIYHIHLLYLNALMLLYRRVSAKCNTMLTLGRAQGDAWAPPENFRRILQEGTIAAKHSSRILSLLLDENGVFKQCWLMIYQAYVSGTILLYSIVQKQLHSYDPSEWAEDLAQADRCLAILEFCGSKDSVARKMHDILALPYKVLHEHVMMKRPSPEEFDASHLPSEAELFQSLKVTDRFTDHLHMLPLVGPLEHISVSMTLLYLVCRPFDTLSDEMNFRESIRQDTIDEDDKYEFLQTTERLDWDFGSGVPYQWGLDEQACQMVYTRLLGQNRYGIFLGSAQPSGWKS